MALRLVTLALRSHHEDRNMNKRLLSRRDFSGLCAALPAVSVMSTAFAGAFTLAAATAVASSRAERTVKFRDGSIVPALGQGSWHLAQGRHPEAVEEEALRTGLSLGMTLIDTRGGVRRRPLRGIDWPRDCRSARSRIPGLQGVAQQAAENGIARACEASLARLGTDHLDLYLLHWPSGIIDLSGVVAAFESLRAAGKIRAWGVSNFNVSDMEDLFRVPHGDRCATNQVLYNVGNRGIEHDLLPWCEQRGMPVMAYTPLGGASLLHDPTLARIGAAHGCSAAAVALAWAIRSGNVIAIPESGSPAHVKENAVALSLTLTPQELQMLDAAHPPPDH